MQTPQLGAHINVTPMIDVMLVLLIIFMVVVPVIAIQVDLPVATRFDVAVWRARAGDACGARCGGAGGGGGNGTEGRAEAYGILKSKGWFSRTRTA